MKTTLYDLCQELAPTFINIECILDKFLVIAHRPGICVHSAELLRRLDSGEEAGAAAANMSQPMDDTAA